MSHRKIVSRPLSFLDGLCLATSQVVGTGIFALTGLALEKGGVVGSVLGWGLAALAIVPFLWLFMRLSQRACHSGGLSSQATQVLGPWAGRSMAFLLCGTFALVIPVIAYVGATYTQKCLGLKANHVPVVAFILVALGTGLTLMGSQWIQRISKLSFLALVTLLLFLLAYHASLIRIGWQSFRSSLPYTKTTDLVSASRVAVLVFFAFIGWENFVPLSRKLAHGPQQSRWVYLSSFLLVTTLYLSLAFLTLGASSITTSNKGIAGLLPLVERLPFPTLFLLMATVVLVANATTWSFCACETMMDATQGPHPRGIFGTALVCERTQFFLFGVYGFVLSLLTSDTLLVTSAVQLTGQNFLFLYWLAIFTYVKGETHWSRYWVGAAAIASTALMLKIGISLFYPIGLLLLGLFGNSWHRHQAMQPRKNATSAAA